MKNKLDEILTNAMIEMIELRAENKQCKNQIENDRKYIERIEKLYLNIIKENNK